MMLGSSWQRAGSAHNEFCSRVFIKRLDKHVALAFAFSSDDAAWLRVRCGSIWDGVSYRDRQADYFLKEIGLSCEDKVAFLDAALEQGLLLSSDTSLALAGWRDVNITQENERDLVVEAEGIEGLILRDTGITCRALASKPYGGVYEEPLLVGPQNLDGITASSREVGLHSILVMLNESIQKRQNNQAPAVSDADAAASSVSVRTLDAAPA